jgi:hypothetical protein
MRESGREHHFRASRHALEFVMAGPVPAIHVLKAQKTWMAGINPAMTKKMRGSIHRTICSTRWVDESIYDGP